MTEGYNLEQHEEYRAKVDAEEAAKEQARVEKAEKETARRAWVNDGGSESAFEKQWPRLRDEARADRVKSADQRAREAQRETSRI